MSKSVEKENFKLQIIAWICTVEANKGMTRKQMQVLMDEMPEAVDVVPLLIEAGISINKKRIVGFIDKDYHEDYAWLLSEKLPLLIEENKTVDLIAIEGQVVKLKNEDYAAYRQQIYKEHGYIIKPYENIDVHL